MGKSFDREFLEKIRIERLRRGVSLIDAAQGICSPSYLSLLESLKRSPSVRIATLLSDRFGVPFSDNKNLTWPSADFESFEAALRLGDDKTMRLVRENLEHSSEIQLAEALVELSKANYILALQKLQDIDTGPVATWLKLKVGLATTKAMRDMGQFNNAVRVGEATLLSCKEQIQVHPGIGFEIRAIISSAYVELGDIDRARELAGTSSEFRDSSPIDRANHFWSLAAIEYSAGKVLEARLYAQRALGVIEAVDEPISKARLQNVAASLELLKLEPDLHEVNQLLTAAEIALQNSGFVVDIAACNSTWGEYYSFMGDLANSKLHYGKALMLLPADGHEIAGRIYSAAAISYFRLGELAECHSCLAKARELVENSGARRSTAIVWRQMGAVYEQLGETSLALACLKASAELLGVTAPNIYSQVRAH